MHEHTMRVRQKLTNVRMSSIQITDITNHTYTLRVSTCCCYDHHPRTIIVIITDEWDHLHLGQSAEIKRIWRMQRTSACVTSSPGAFSFAL